MTVSNTTRRAEFACNGSTHEFDYLFPLDAEDDLVVVVRDEDGAETILTLTSDYEISTAVADDYTAGGTVTTVTYASGTRAVKDWAAGNTLIVYRETPITQESTYFTNRGWRQENIEHDFDKSTMILQELEDNTARCLQAPVTDEDADLTLPNAVLRAGKYLSFDTNGLPVVADKTLSEVTATDFGASLAQAATASAGLTLLGVSTFAKTILDDTTAAGVRATIGASTSTMTYVDDYAVGDGTTDDTAAIEAAIAAAPTGGILQFGAKTYKITDEIAVDKALTICGYGYTSQVKQVTGSKGVFVGTVSGISVYDLYHYGPQYGASATEIAIKVTGASAAAMVEKIKVERCFFKNWGYGAVYLEFVKQFSVFKNVIEDVHYTGVAAICATDGDVSYNYIDDIPSSVAVGWNAYGIILTRNPVDSLVDSPRASRITCTHNIITNIPTWDAINTHAGSALLIANNATYNCYRGVNATDCPGTDTTTMYAPQNVKIIGNHLESGVGDGSYDLGICLNGSTDGAGLADVQEWAVGCSIIGNTVIGYGKEDTAQSGGIFFAETLGMVCTGNVTRFCSPNGIVPYALNLDFIVDSCSCVDIWTSTLAIGEAVGVNVVGAQNINFLISNLTASELGTEGGSGTYLLNDASGSAVKVANSAGNAGKLGLVHGNATAVLSDAGSKISKNLN